jgi:hypothetical protein
MAIDTTLPDDPSTTNRPTIRVTERGHRLLALLRVREILPASSTVVAAVLERRIDELLAEDLADEKTVTLAEERMQITGPLTVQKEPWL